MRGYRGNWQLAATTIFGSALAWGLWHYGATEIWELYRLFLWLLTPALILAWTLPTAHWLGTRWLVLLPVGCCLMAQIAWRPTLEGQGYTLASLGWLGLFLGLGLASQGRKAAWRVVVVIVVAGAAEALYSLTQVLFEGGPISGHHRSYGATGTLFNRNHFAGLLNMTLPLAIGALAAKLSRGDSRRPAGSETRAYAWVMVLSCALMGLATLLSLSRGGVLTLVSTLVFMASLLAVDRYRSWMPGLSPRFIGLLLLAILGLGLAVGRNDLTQRLANLSDGWEGRLDVYADSLQLIRDHPVFGVGPGMYRWRFRPYQTSDPERRYDHAHNDYLETAADWGAPAAMLFWGFVAGRLYLVCCRFYELRSAWRQGLALGCAGSIFSILLHSLVDFNLQIPTHLTIFCAILGLAWSLEPSNEAAESPVARTASRTRLAVQRFLIQVLLPLLIASAGWRVLHQFKAAQIARQQLTPAGLEEALRWDFEGPGYHYRLGVLYRDVSELRDLDKARAYLEKATELNPFNWRYRRELAQLYELSGSSARAEKAYLQAVSMNPRSGSYRWRLANFYLRNGSLEEAIPQLKRALAADRRLFVPTPGLLLKAGGSYEHIDRIWPGDQAARRELLRLVSRRESSAVESSAMEYLSALWDQLLNDSGPLTFADGMVYIQRLMKERLFAEARQRWVELARRNNVLDARFETESTYLWNGGFESPLTQAGLGWQIRPAVGFSANRADGEGLGESTALRLDFDGSQNLSFLGVQQQVVVDPGRTYRLSFHIRCRDLSTDRGAYLEVVDGHSGQILLMTESVLGSIPWTPYAGTFRVTEESHWVLVRLSRKPSLRFDNQLRGVLWIDSLSLELSS